MEKSENEDVSVSNKRQLVQNVKGSLPREDADKSVAGPSQEEEQSNGTKEIFAILKIPPFVANQSSQDAQMMTQVLLVSSNTPESNQMAKRFKKILPEVTKDSQSDQSLPKSVGPFIKRCHYCGICLTQFSTATSLAEHLSRDHKEINTPVYSCSICDKTFQNEDSVLTHMLSHSKIRHECNMCNQTFEEKAKLEEHLLSVHVRQGGKALSASQLQQVKTSFSREKKDDPKGGNKSRHKCLHCHKVFLCKSSLDKHLESHKLMSSASKQPQISTYHDSQMDNTNNKDVTEDSQNLNFEPICEEQNKSLEVFVYKKSHHSPQKESIESENSMSHNLRYKCNSCLQEFTSQSDLKNHIKVHKENRSFPCPHCGNVYARMNSLRKHIRSSCKDAPKMNDEGPVSLSNNKNIENQESKEQSREQKYKCGICLLAFKSRIYLKMHLKIHETNRSFPCRYCGNVYKTMSGLRTHQKSFCRTVNKCDLCQQMFSTGLDLKAHLKKHNDLRSHPCQYCGNVYARMNSLRKHQKSRCKKAPWSNKNPPMSVTVKQKRKRKYPFTCPLRSCMRGFATKMGFDLHLETHDTGIPFLCGICKISFHHRRTLKSHMRFYHDLQLQGGKESININKDPAANHGYKCETCNSTFVTLQLLNDHLQMHLGIMPDECSLYNEKQPDLYSVQQLPVVDTVKIERNEEAPCSSFEPAEHVEEHEDTKSRPEDDVQLTSKSKTHVDDAKKQKKTKRKTRKKCQPIRPHLCELCGQHFTAKNSLKKHQMRAVNCWEKKLCFQCPDCFGSFPNKTEMRRHRLKQHPVLDQSVGITVRKSASKFLKCEKCFSDFLSYGTFVKHQQNCGVEFSVYCATCGDKFNEVKALDNHVLEYHCIHLNANIISYKEPQRKPKGYNAAGVKHFKCGICGKSFCTAKILSEHMGIHTGEMPYTCEKCGVRYLSEKALSKHKQVTACGAQDGKFVCKYCKKMYDSLKDLREHQSSKLGLRFTCEKCGSSLGSCYHLQKHLNKCQREAESITCKICGKTFANPSNVKDHMMVHTGVKPFACGQCGRRFTFKQSLKRHLAIHGGDLAYKCRICDRGFTILSALKIHEKTHLDVKLRRNYSCPDCGKGFTSQQRLKRHSYLHSNKKPFSCQFCGKGFTNSFHLNSHLNSQHGVPYEEHPCKFCGQTFQSRFKLTQHLDLNCAGLAATIQQLPTEHSLVASLRDDEDGNPVGQSSVATKSTEIVIQEDDGNGNVTERTIFVTLPPNVELSQWLQNGLVNETHVNPGLKHSDAVETISFDDDLQKDVKDVERNTVGITCQHCGEICMSGEEMENHLQHQHPSVESAKPLVKGVCYVTDITSTIEPAPNENTSHDSPGELHMCQHCGKQFQRGSDLNCHILKCEQAVVPISQDPDYPLTEEQTDNVCEKTSHLQNEIFMCEECGVQFSRLNDLQCHKLNMHDISSNDVKNIETDNTDMRCLPSSNTSEPVKTSLRENGVKQYPCDMCHKTFVRLQSLKKHKLTHTRGVGFFCTLCGKSYSYEASLLDHMEVHESDNTKKYRCAICSNSFTKKHSLRQHMLTHSKEAMP